MNKMGNQRELSNILKELLESRSELLKRGSLTIDNRKVVELDQTSVGRLSRIDAMQRQEMALEQERRRIFEIKKIDAALERLNHGQYGVCIKCDEFISAQRLAFDPAIALCVNCAKA